MLRPDYFNDKADKMLEIYEKLEYWILEDIADRLIESMNISGTTDRELWKLEQMGLHHDYIVSRLEEITDMSEKELRELLQEAVLTSWEDDKNIFEQMGKRINDPLSNRFVREILSAELEKANNSLENLTRTTMLQSDKDLMKMLNEADVRNLAGVDTVARNVREILKAYAKKGASVYYPDSRTTRSLESAVRLILTTSLNQASAQVTNHYIHAEGVEYVLVSAHLGARHSDKHPQSLESHDWWQGKVFKIRGEDDDAPNLLYSTGYDIKDGIGRVADPLGLHGYNCRHSHQPWDKDLTNPWVDKDGKPIIDNEQSKARYKAEQTQRGMERAIRGTKRQLIALDKIKERTKGADYNEAVAEYDKLAYRLKEQQEQYELYCQKNGLPNQIERAQTAEFRGKRITEAKKRAKAYAQELLDND